MANEKGGAIDCGSGSATITDCIFIDNTAGTGGAINIEGAATVTNCIFSNNSVENNEYGGLGGGLAVVSSDSAATVINCSFYNCRSASQGGGVYVGTEGAARFINCTFSENEALIGSGIGLEDADAVTLVNCIVAFGLLDAAVSGTGGVDFYYSNIFGNAGGDWTGSIADQLGVNGNICEDPLFVDSSKGDLHLYYDSPCRNSGDSSASDLPDSDWEGDPRVADGSPDMGADEFHTHLYYTGDPAAGETVAVKLVGEPAAGPVGLFWSFGLCDAPSPTPWGDFFVPKPWLLFVLEPVPSDGVLTLSGAFHLSGTESGNISMQALIGDELTNTCVLIVPKP